MSLDENLLTITLKRKLYYAPQQSSIVRGSLEILNGSTQWPIQEQIMPLDKEIILFEDTISYVQFPIDLILDIYDLTTTGKQVKISDTLVALYNKVYIPFNEYFTSFLLRNAVSNAHTNSIWETASIMKRMSSGNYLEYYEMQIIFSSEVPSLPKYYREAAIRQLRYELETNKGVFLSHVVPPDVLRQFIRHNYNQVIPTYANDITTVSTQSSQSIDSHAYNQKQWKKDTLFQQDTGMYENYKAILPDLTPTLAMEINLNLLRKKLGFDANYGFYQDQTIHPKKYDKESSDRYFDILPATTEMILRRSRDMFGYINGDDKISPYVINNMINDGQVLAELAFLAGSLWKSVPLGIVQYVLYKSSYGGIEKMQETIKPVVKTGLESTAVAANNYFLHDYNSIHDLFGYLGQQIMDKPTDIVAQLIAMGLSTIAIKYVANPSVLTTTILNALGAVNQNKMLQMIPEFMSYMMEGGESSIDIAERNLSNQRDVIWSLNENQIGSPLLGQLSSLKKQLIENSFVESATDEMVEFSLNPPEGFKKMINSVENIDISQIKREVNKLQLPSNIKDQAGKILNTFERLKRALQSPRAHGKPVKQASIAAGIIPQIQEQQSILHEMLQKLPLEQRKLLDNGLFERSKRYMKQLAKEGQDKQFVDPNLFILPYEEDRSKKYGYKDDVNYIEALNNIEQYAHMGAQNLPMIQAQQEVIRQLENQPSSFWKNSGKVAALATIIYGAKLTYDSYTNQHVSVHNMNNKIERFENSTDNTTSQFDNSTTNMTYTPTNKTNALFQFDNSTTNSTYQLNNTINATSYLNNTQAQGWKSYMNIPTSEQVKQAAPYIAATTAGVGTIAGIYSFFSNKQTNDSLSSDSIAQKVKDTISRTEPVKNTLIIPTSRRMTQQRTRFNRYLGWVQKIIEDDDQVNILNKRKREIRQRHSEVQSLINKRIKY